MRDVAAYLFRVGTDVVGCCDDGPRPVLQVICHHGNPGFFIGVQQVVPLNVGAVASEFVEARDAIDVGLHAPVFAQDVGGRDDFSQNRATAQQLNA